MGCRQNGWTQVPSMRRIRKVREGTARKAFSRMPSCDGTAQNGVPEVGKWPQGRKVRSKMRKPIKGFAVIMVAKYDGIVSKLMKRYRNDTDRLSDDVRFWNALASAMAWREMA